MSAFKTVAINTAAKLLLSSRLWNDAKMFVQEAQMDTNLTGAEKRSRVKQNLLLVLGDIGDVILHLAIELAVYFLKEQVRK
jgi:hypothetical protein